MPGIEFPVQIGLVGAPGSGKQRLVDEFIKIAGSWFEENDSPLFVVRNPGEVIEQEHDQAMGAFGSYVEDFWAFFNRYERESQLRLEGKSFISLGTALDNIAHCGVNMESIVAGVQTPQTEQRFQKQQVAMTTLTFLFLDRFKYLFGFYLPYKASVVLPGDDEFDANYNARIDKALQMVFANFGLRIQTLDQPTFEEKAQAMFDTIKDIVENGPKPIEEESEPQPELETSDEDQVEPDSPPVEEATLAG